LPANTKEKDEFKKSILAMSWKPEEHNFAEAHNAALQAFIPYSIPSAVQAVLDDAKANPDNITADSSPFWILSAAVRLFVQKEGHGKFLPLMGAIPDMEAETNIYIDLQNVYKHKSEADQAAVRAHVNAILTRIGKGPETISDDLLTLFCKNALFIRVFRYRSLADEFNPETSTVAESSWQLEDTATNNLHWYLLIRAALRFEQQHGRLPSSDVSGDSMQDYNEYKNHVQTLLKEHNLAEDAISNDSVKEFCRYGGSQLHNLGAILGGVASQEILKITTKQWIPVNNTYIFNGMCSNSSSYEF
jgi:NEDD8-activating enzyme E1 regulatory subunit